jgi:hypothetical protein
VEKLKYVLLDKKGNPVPFEEVTAYTPEDVSRKLRTLKPNLYTVLTIDLAIARTGLDKEAFYIAGTFIAVSAIDGTASLIFNEPSNDQLSLAAHEVLKIPFYRLFIVNTAQATKSVTLIIGRESLFELKWIS